LIISSISEILPTKYKKVNTPLKILYLWYQNRNTGRFCQNKACLQYNVNKIIWLHYLTIFCNQNITVWENIGCVGIILGSLWRKNNPLRNSAIRLRKKVILFPSELWYNVDVASVPLAQY
jgi:hypothetical protein